jgi:methylated-DNA-[protein]-cysteine S-methyltransferase
MTVHTAVLNPSHTVLDSPIGPLTLIAADGKLTGVYMDPPRYPPSAAAFGAAEPADAGPADAAPDAAAQSVLAAAASQLRAYFAGELTSFDLPIELEGTAFQAAVWAALQTIDYGETISYGQLADRIGQPSASRAVGLANGRNPVSIIVPCHRVIGADGSLTGYGGGLDRKRYLLSLEQRVSGQTLA